MRKSFVAVAVLLLSCTPLLATETVVSGPLVISTPETYNDTSDGLDLMRGSFYNPSPIVVDDTLHVYLMADLWGGTPVGWTACEHGDQIVHFTTDDIGDDLVGTELVSPCCGNEEALDTHYTTGSVSDPPWGSDYMIFVGHTVGGANWSEGDFKDVLIGLSDDLTGWTFPGYETGDCDDAGNINPLISQYCYGNPEEVCVSFADVNLVSDGNDTLWGVFRFGTSGANKVGRMQMIEDSENVRGFYVQVHTDSGWSTINDDGSHTLEEDDITDIWHGARINSLFYTGTEYELWAWEYNLSGVTEGCDDPRGGGSKLVYRTITEGGTLGDKQQVTSTDDDLPMPSRGNQSYTYPARVDFDGDELVLITSNYRACETMGLGENPPWPGGWGGGFRGMEIIAASLNNTITANDCNPWISTACLYDDRFEVELVYGANDDPAVVIPFGDQSVGWRFLEPSNVELATKLVDDTGSSNYWQVVWGSLTAHDYTMTVTDTLDGSYETYEDASSWCGDADLTAFYDPPFMDPNKNPNDEYDISTDQEYDVATDQGYDFSTDQEYDKSYYSDDKVHRHLIKTSTIGDGSNWVGTCTASATKLCLFNKRFEVTVTESSTARNRVKWTDNSGAFYFSDDHLIELPVKVIEGTPLTGDYWFYHGSLTNGDWLITLTDTVDGSSNVYRAGTDYCGEIDYSL